MTTAGYFRFPTIHDETIVFVAEDDLWSVATSGGTARRLTASVGEISHPFLSPDGRQLAFTGRDEGPAEIYVMPAEGGPEKRLTFEGAACQVVGWSRDGRSILYASSAGQPFSRRTTIHAVPRTGGLPNTLPLGHASTVSYGPKRGVIVGRYTADPARWKRYRGGRVGVLWVDARGTGAFRKLPDLGGNVGSPMWVGNRIYFLSDHEGVGNLYSCSPSGRDLARHTDHEEFYARNATTDGRRIVYHAGADLYVFDPARDKAAGVPMTFRSSRTQRNRKFVETAGHLESYAPHPHGHSVALTVRGRLVSLGNWDGPVVQHGRSQGVRYRLAAWLRDGKRLVAVGDEGGEESLVVFSADSTKRPKRLGRIDIGRPVELIVSPKRNQVVLYNHRGELMMVDLTSGRRRVLDRSAHGRLHGIAFSPDGRWIAYSLPTTRQTAIIMLCRLSTGRKHAVTSPVLRDVSPAFDPDGRYLYFLSYREFDPVYDNLQFDLNFPRGVRPYLVLLSKDLRCPFQPEPKAPGKGDDDEDDHADKGHKKKKGKPLKIDLDGIENRVLAFPVHDGDYEQIHGLHDDKVIFSSADVAGSLDDDSQDPAPASHALLQMYDFNEQKLEDIVDELTDFAVSADCKTLFYRAGNRLRAIKAGEKHKDDDSEETSRRESGWLDLRRVRVSVSPPDEWRQMYREAWRLQRDHFWTENMSGVNWKKVYTRYLPLLDRITTRSEFSDLMWEMQGELSSSHAYESGGDYRTSPRYQQGFLGADFAYDADGGGYRIRRIVRGDPWAVGWDSPLHSRGANVRKGQILVAINGQRLSRKCTPQELLVNQAGVEVQLTISTGRRTRNISVKTLRDETPARYREWVEKNRATVHNATRDRIGYVHVPDMGPRGYGEFHRYYLAESQRDGLIIDVRFNSGGHVSQLILEKLFRRRIGYDVPRWGQAEPYPADSVLGPKVAITNESAGSDGDIFSHCFKLLGMGPLIGKRTWGGVIGIWPRHGLVDGSVTTQPEYSFWFEDVGWGVENYGTDPDIEVDITPTEDAAGKDPQLQRAIRESLRLLRASPSKKPAFGNRPKLTAPRLPRRRKGK